jgi:regulator of CtrA degradation
MHAATLMAHPSHLYNEAVELLEEARLYLVGLPPDAVPPSSAADFAVESSRLTARLTEAMAWLMARRAVALGELSFEAGRKHFRLDQRETCRSDRSDVLGPELEPLRLLLVRSLRLYQRLEALDAAFEPAPAERSLRLVSA